MKTTLNKKERKNEKRKLKARKKRNRIIVSIVISVLLWAIYFIAVNYDTRFISFSDENTESYSGIAKDVWFEKRRYSGKRYSTWVFLKLENEKSFCVNLDMLLEKDINYDSFREIVLEKQVEIKSAKAKPEKIVSIECENNDILTLEDTNKNQFINKIAVAFVVLVVNSFAVFLYMA